jgi:hypothetical protein
MEEFKTWLTTSYDKIQEYDKEYSDIFCIPRSIKTTTIKPSGTVSIIAGASAGMHFPISNYLIRRVTLSKNSPYVSKIRNAGYKIEPLVNDPVNSVSVQIPVCIGENVRCQKDVSMWEQLSLAAFLQKYFVDNQVSATITFDKELEGPQIPHAMNYFQYQLKGISFCPSTETSKKYKLVGKMHDEHIKAMCENEFLPNGLIKCEYNSTEDNTYIEFGSNISHDVIEQTLNNLRIKGSYQIDSRRVTPYPQMPLEGITKQEYENLIKHLRPVDWNIETYTQEEPSRQGLAPKSSIPNELSYCDSEHCLL